jgi:hypothetical protein
VKADAAQPSPAQPSRPPAASEIARLTDRREEPAPSDAAPRNDRAQERAAPPPAAEAQADRAVPVAPRLAAAPAAKALGAVTSGLIGAAEAGDLEAVRRQLATTPADAQRDSEGRTALAIAVLRSDVRMVSLLLAQGANRLSTDKQGKTPLDHAVAIDNPAVLELIAR